MILAELICFLLMVVVFAIWGKKLYKQTVDLKRLDNGFREYYEVVSRWLVLKNSGRKVEEFFIHNGFLRIAVYGAGPLGELLCQELKNSPVEVVCAIDKNKKEFEFLDGVKIITPEVIEEQGSFDAVIITPMLHKTEIMDFLCNKNLVKDTKFIMVDEFVNFYYHHEEE